MMSVMDTALDHEIVVIGAGFAGIGAAIKLRQAGFSDFVVLDEADGVGGTWHWNTYPGVAVDIPSFSYQFSFEKRSDWSRIYAPGRELKAYAEHCTDKYGVRGHFRLNTRVIGTTFDEDANAWRIDTADGQRISARFVIGATGVFSQPKLPEIPGVETFAGPTVHTARWDHSVELRGKRVAVIGTGASARPGDPRDRARGAAADRLPAHADLVPAEARRAAGLPRPRRPALGARRDARGPLAQPGVRRADVRARRPLRRHVPVPAGSRGGRSAQAARRRGGPGRARQADAALPPRLQAPELLQRVHPHLQPRRTCDLETAAIDEITPEGVRTADGVLHPIDVLVLATGYKVFEKGNMPPFPVSGVGGVELAEFWDANRQQAYEGVSVPGFPNWFTITGPYGFNGQSYFGLIETQMRHIVRCLERARSEHATRVEITPEANQRYFESVLARRGNQVFFRGSCANSNSYYFDKHGDVPFRPSLTLEAAWRSARFDLDDYDFAASPGTNGRPSRHRRETPVSHRIWTPLGGGSLLIGRLVDRRVRVTRHDDPVRIAWQLVVSSRLCRLVELGGLVRLGLRGGLTVTDRDAVAASIL